MKIVITTDLDRGSADWINVECTSDYNFSLYSSTFARINVV